jgi:DNA-binding helix-hairpin-helix protein with protein kinase domain
LAGLGGHGWQWVIGGGNERKAEWSKRKKAHDAAQQAYDQIIDRIRASREAFVNKKQGLVLLRNEYQQLPEREESEIANLRATAEARQRRKFLERHFLDAAAISVVGPARKATLRSFGIETAADVTWNKVISVIGFGEVLTQAVVDWRKVCEHQFVFDPNLAITEVDREAVRVRIAIRRCELEIALATGAVELQRLRQDTINELLYCDLQAASQKLAQSQADLNAIA